MDRKARYPFKWFGLLTPLGVLLTMTLGTANLRASPIDDERQPETFRSFGLLRRTG